MNWKLEIGNLKFKIEIIMFILYYYYPLKINLLFIFLYFYQDLDYFIIEDLKNVFITWKILN